VINSLWEILAPNGLMHHVIDFRDHRHYYDPDRYPALPIIGDPWSDPNTNGIRYDGWIEIFNNLDAEIVDEQVVKNSNDILSLEIILRKKSGGK